MSCSCKSETWCVTAGSSTLLMARAKKTDGTYLVQADCSSVRIDVYDVDQAGTRTNVDTTGTAIPVATDGTFAAYDSPSVASVVSNTLVTTVWTPDSLGRNVSYLFSAPLIDHVYEVRMKITLADTSHVVIVWALNAN